MSVGLVRNYLFKEKIDAFLVMRPENVRYISGYTGTDSYLIVQSSRIFFITDPRYMEQAEAECPNCIRINWRQEGVSLALALAAILRKAEAKTAAFEADFLTYLAYKDMQETAACSLIPTTGVIEEYRKIKRPDEIEKLKQSCAIADRAFARLLEDLKPGVTEKDIAARLSLYLVAEGSDPQPYGGILISGKRTSLLHGIPSEKKLAKGDLVLMDFGGAYQSYLADMTRTVVLGEATYEQRETYAMVRAMFDAARKKIRRGAAASDIYQGSIQPIEGTRYHGYHYTGIGHGIGLFVHEAPFISPASKDVLAENMVITLEPGIYIPGWGGIRLENQMLITKDGFIDMTNSPQELIELPI